MKQKIINKHIIRAISIGLTAVMASTPVTAFASEAVQDPAEPTAVPEQNTDQVKYHEAESAVETAQETVNEAPAVVLDTAVELPGSGTEASVVPNAQEAVNEEILEEVLTEADGEEIQYADVEENLANAGNDLVSAEADLIQADSKEQAAKADVLTAEEQIKESSDLSNSVTIDHTLAEDAAEKSQQAVENAEESGKKEVILESLGEAKEAVDQATAAEVSAQEKYNQSEEKLAQANDKLAEAEKNFKEAQESLDASKNDIEKALQELEQAKSEADALRQEVNNNAKELAETKAAKLKAAYEKMMTTAKEEEFTLYAGEASKEDGIDDEYTEEFGREKASAAYWKDSLEYFKLYIEYIYGDKEEVSFDWKEQGEHFAKNNAYQVSYKDEDGNTVTKYFNYHLADESGNISIYEKTEGSETYTETETIAEMKDIFRSDASVNYEDIKKDTDIVLEKDLDEEGNAGKYLVKDDNSVKVEGINLLEEFEKTLPNGKSVDLDEESVMKNYEETQILVPDVNGTVERIVSSDEKIESFADLERMVNKLSPEQFIEVEMENINGGSKVIFSINSGMNLAMVFEDMFGMAPGQYFGKNGAAVTLKEKCRTEAGIKETVKGNYTVTENKGIELAADYFTKEGNKVPSESHRQNDIRALIEDEVKKAGGTAANIQITKNQDGSYSISYDLVLSRIGIIIEENTYTATTYTKNSEEVQTQIDVEKERTFWQERKDTTKDSVIKEAIEKVQKELEKLMNQQDAAAKAYAAVEQAEIDAKKAKEELDKLSVDDSGYKKALVDYQQAKENLEKANAQLNNIRQKVKKTQEDYEKIAGMLKDENGGGNKRPEGGEVTGDETTPDPVVPTVPPTVVPVTDETPAEIPTPEVTESRTASAGVIQEQEATVLIAAAEEEVPLGGSLEDMLQEEKEEMKLEPLEEEPVPMAAIDLSKENMSWWWLLIVALLGGTGYKMYKNYQEKQALNEEE